MNWQPPELTDTWQPPEFQDNTVSNTDDSWSAGLNSNAARITSGMIGMANGVVNLPSDIYQSGKQVLNNQPMNKTPLARDIQTVANTVKEALPHIVNDPQAGGAWRLDPGAIYKQLEDIAANPIKEAKKNPIDTVMAIAPFLDAGANIGMGLAKEAAPSIQDSAIKAASAYFGPSEDAIRAKIADPSIGKIPSEELIPQTADSLSFGLNDLQKKLSSIEDNVWGSLLKLKAEPKSSILGMINNIKGQIKVTGTGEVGSDAAQSALDYMDRQATRIKNMNTANLISPVEYGNANKVSQFFTQPQLREIIQSAGDDINWEDKYASVKNEAATNFRKYVSNYLKDQNPQYADLIQQSADRTSLLEDAKSAFALDRSGGSFSSTNATAGKIQGLLNPKNIATQEVADRLKNLTGLDMRDAAQKIKYTQEFEKTATQGSRRAVMGKAAGAALGALLDSGTGVKGMATGGFIGASAGGYADKYAAQNLGNIIDRFNKMGFLKK